MQHRSSVPIKFRKGNFFSVLFSEYLYETQTKRVNLFRILYTFIMSPTFRANVYVNLKDCCKSKYKRRIICNHLHSKFSIVVSPISQIGEHLFLAHPLSVVIGDHVKIGRYVTIYQNVTLGQKNGQYPIVGDNVVIYAGAVIVGNIKIGDNAVVGANAVVINDVPAYATAVGVPAHVIERKDVPFDKLKYVNRGVDHKVFIDAAAWEGGRHAA